MSAAPAIRIVPVDESLHASLRSLAATPAQCIDVGAVADQLADIAACPGSTGFAFLLDDTAIGFCRIDDDARSLAGRDLGAGTLGLRGFMIDARRQGRGLGRLALDALLAHLRTHRPGACALALAVRDGNRAARLLYRRTGFVELGSLYHDARGEAHLLLRRDLTRPPQRPTVLDHQREFLDLALERGVLRFGEFTLKSGRISPYFFNLGRVDGGAALARLGRAYATTAQASGLQFDMLFGPAYKGIPLAAATAIALADRHGRDLPFAYNRKEAKDHGEGGSLVGAPLAGRVLIVDDVMTAGTAVRESLALIRAHGATPAGVLIALDRQERGQGSLSAAQELTAEEGIPVVAIARLEDVLAYAGERPELAAEHDRLQAYRARYGSA